MATYSSNMASMPMKEMAMDCFVDCDTDRDRPIKDLAEESAETEMNANAEDVALLLEAGTCPEFQELYKFLESCFDQTDRNGAGLIGAAEFAEMCGRAGAEPRKLRDAPLTSETHASDAERIRARGKMFDDIGATNTRWVRDTISFNVWV